MIETLEKVEKDRRCFRLVGGVLVERQVGEVEPALVGNKEKVSSFGLYTYTKYLLICIPIHFSAVLMFDFIII